MLRTLIVGLGQAGLNLHLPVLARIRDTAVGRELFSSEPIIGYDLCGPPTDRLNGTLLAVTSLAEARELLDPADTVVHVCTPPSVRAELLWELAELGFRKNLVEKPLAPDRESMAQILGMRSAWDLDLVVVSHWLDSALTRELTKIVYSGELGALRSIHAVQRKPRFRRSIATSGHPSAFEVEVPHSLAVALRLAGDATVVSASWQDMEIDGLRVPRMGGAHLVLQHDQGTRTEIASVLTSMLRERKIELEFMGGRVVGYYPVSRDDDYALLTVHADGREKTSVFRDDSLASFLTRTYREFAAGNRVTADLELNIELVSLLSDAKHLCEASDRGLMDVSGTSGGTVEHVS
jgi:predicted dehydrogenase